MYGPQRDCKRKLEREQALVGLDGLVAYSVARRTHEIGIRLAIGDRDGNGGSSFAGR